MRRGTATFPWFGLLAVLIGAVPALTAAFVLSWRMFDRLLADDVREAAGAATMTAVMIALALALGGFAFSLARRFWRELEEWRFGPEWSGPTRLF
jgi:hypothetical protein